MKKYKLLTMALILSAIMFTVFGCGNGNEPVDAKNIWKCTLESNATIKLTIDEQQSKMCVTTSPQDLSSRTGREERIRNGEFDYVLRGDTMFLKVDDYGWIKTMLSPNSMQLDYFGGIFLIGGLRTSYLFTRQTYNN